MKKKKVIRSAVRAAQLLASLLNSASNYALADTAARLPPLPADGTAQAGASDKSGFFAGTTSQFWAAAQVTTKSIDSIHVPPPYVAPKNHDAYLALEAKATGDVSEVLNKLGLVGDQRIMVRNYIGQYDKETQVVATGNVNGVETFGIRDRKTQEWIGTIGLRAAPGGAVQVDKAIGMELDYQHSVDLPVPGTVNVEAAKQVLGNSKEYSSLAQDAKDSKIDVTVPLVKVKQGVDYGSARQATALFNADGTGHEYGLVTKVASAKAEATLNTSGVEVGAGAKGPEVEGFANYFGPPNVDAEGNLTHSVYGGSFEVHGTLAEIGAKAGCQGDKGCGASASLGALGIGMGGGLTLSTATAIPVDSVEEIQPRGMAAPPSETETGKPAGPASAEDLAFEHATADGSPAALQKFLSDYPTSDRMPEVVNLMELGASGEAPDAPAGMPNSPPGIKGY